MARQPTVSDRYLGARLKVLRKAGGYDLTAFANALQISPAALDAMERGRGRLSSAALSRAAELLGCTVAHLFEGAPEAARPS
jgi:transcriptional regulator with XRE-family HTH domain